MQRKPNEVGVTIVGQNVDRFLLPRRLALPWHYQYVGLFLPRAPQLICCKKRRWSNDLVRCKSIQRKVTAVLQQNWPWAWPTHHGVKKRKISLQKYLCVLKPTLAILALSSQGSPTACLAFRSFCPQTMQKDTHEDKHSTKSVQDSMLDHQHLCQNPGLKEIPQHRHRVATTIIYQKQDRPNT